ncbi:hypothetical protein HDU96_000889 [Phlyctochytrium bullatum]|nr:hypothetical protein HDU96_000889 [Phlyctochytrium bullatum]
MPSAIEHQSDYKLIKLAPIELPASATDIDPLFGRVVEGVDLNADLSPALVDELHRALLTHSVLLFRPASTTAATVRPVSQLALTRAMDKTAPGDYGHGKSAGKQAGSILHPDLKTIPSVPQVQLIGNGFVAAHEGLENVTLKHPHHRSFHANPVSVDDEVSKGITRFYRWHMDAALYDLPLPVATTLHAIKVPAGPAQTLRYDDGTGDELEVPLGTTAFVSGAQMFDILPPELKSVAVRTKVRYAPYPYVWMGKARAMPDGLGIESEGRELDLGTNADGTGGGGGEGQVPAWTEDKVKIYPMVWKNPVTSRLQLQVHPCAVQSLHIAPLPADHPSRATALYPDGAALTDLKIVRELLHTIQRPAIAPARVYAHDWREGDLVMFHNRGVLHTVVGAFSEDQVRMFHQCNLASGADPEGPSEEEVAAFL